jgi:hypothetical protein
MLLRSKGIQEACPSRALSLGKPILVKKKGGQEQEEQKNADSAKKDDECETFNLY